MSRQFWFFWFANKPLWSSKSFFRSMHSQLSLTAPNLGAHVLCYVAFLEMGIKTLKITTNIGIAKFFSKRILRHGNKESISSTIFFCSSNFPKRLSFRTSHMKSAPQITYYFFILVILNFELQNYSNFDISCTVGLNIMETYHRGNVLVV